jgi:hypothetical protein
MQGNGMSTFILVFALWLAVVVLGSIQWTNLATRNATPPRGAVSQLFYLAPIAALAGWVLYKMGLGLIEGRIKLPVRGDDHYFQVAHQPVGFWTVVAIEFLLTALVAMAIVVATGLILRNHRGGA